MTQGAQVQVEFLHPDENGCRRLPSLNGYRPHFRVSSSPELLGIAFIDGPECVQPSTPVHAKVRFVYLPEVDYTLLTIGAHFEILEGPQVVGYGVIIDLY